MIRRVKVSVHSFRCDTQRALIFHFSRRGAGRYRNRRAVVPRMRCIFLFAAAVASADMVVAIVRPVVEIVSKRRDVLARFDYRTAAVTNLVAGIACRQATSVRLIHQMRTVVAMVRRVGCCVLCFRRNTLRTLILYLSRRGTSRYRNRRAVVPCMRCIFLFAAAVASADMVVAVVRPVVEIVPQRRNVLACFNHCAAAVTDLVAGIADSGAASVRCVHKMRAIVAMVRRVKVSVHSFRCDTLRALILYLP